MCVEWQCTRVFWMTFDILASLDPKIKRWNCGKFGRECILECI